MDQFTYHRFHTPFSQTYLCYPLSYCNKSHLENGDRIIMPASALSFLAFTVFKNPMMFKLTNPTNGELTHCGVEEFDAPEYFVFMPNWMMEHLELEQGDCVNVKSIRLKKGTYVKLQPHTKDFLEISNPRAVLETTLRNFFCLTKGDTIMIMYNDKNFYIDVIETAPSDAVSIFETDCEVDFAPPLDYQEPETPVVKDVMATKKVEEQAVKDDVKFEPFCGEARRLDGRFLMESVVSDCSARLKQISVDEVNERSKATQSNLRSKPGKLVFGSNKELEKNSKEDVALKKGDEKFQPFTGRSYRLTD